MKGKMRILSMILAVTLMFTSMDMSVFAIESTEDTVEVVDEEVVEDAETGEPVEEAPVELFEEELCEDELVGEEDKATDVDNMYDLYEEVRNLIRNREQGGTVTISNNDYTEFTYNDLFDLEAERIGMKPDEGEYMYMSMGKRNIENDLNFSDQFEVGPVYVGDQQVMQVKFIGDMITTKEEERWVDSEVETIIDDMNFSASATDEQKAQAIYNYVTTNVSGYVGSSNSADERKQPINHTAYIALKEHYGTCQAFALLFSRLCREAGLKSRVIMGTDANAHTYNIVKMGSYWYYVDCSSRIWKKSYNEFSRTTEQEMFRTSNFVNNYIRNINGYGSSVSSVGVTVTTSAGEIKEYSDYNAARSEILDQLNTEIRNVLEARMAGDDEPEVTSFKIKFNSDFALETDEQLDFTGLVSVHKYEDYNIVETKNEFSFPYVDIDLNNHTVTAPTNSLANISCKELSNGTIKVSGYGGVSVSNFNVPQGYELTESMLQRITCNYSNVKFVGRDYAGIDINGPSHIKSNCSMSGFKMMTIDNGSTIDCPVKTEQIWIGISGDGNVVFTNTVEADYMYSITDSRARYSQRVNHENDPVSYPDEDAIAVVVDELKVNKGTCLFQGTYLVVNKQADLYKCTYISNTGDGDLGVDFNSFTKAYNLVYSDIQFSNYYPAEIQLVRDSETGQLAKLTMTGNLNEYEVGTGLDMEGNLRGLPGLTISAVKEKDGKYLATDFKSGDDIANANIQAVVYADGKKYTAVDGSNFSKYIKFGPVSEKEGESGEVILTKSKVFRIADYKISEANKTLNKGESFDLKVLNGSTIMTPQSFKSSNDVVAKAEKNADGSIKVTALNGGSATISIVAEDITFTCEVTVTNYLENIIFQNGTDYIENDKYDDSLQLVFTPMASKTLEPVFDVVKGDNTYSADVANTDTVITYTYPTGSPIRKIEYTRATQMLKVTPDSEAGDVTAKIIAKVTSEDGITVKKTEKEYKLYPPEKAGVDYADLTNETVRTAATLHAIIGIDKTLEDVINNSGKSLPEGWTLVNKDMLLQPYSGTTDTTVQVVHENQYTGVVISNSIPLTFTTITGVTYTDDASKTVDYRIMGQNVTDIVTPVVVGTPLSETGRFNAAGKPKLVFSTTTDTKKLEVSILNASIKETTAEGSKYAVSPKAAGKQKITFTAGWYTGSDLEEWHGIKTADGKNNLVFTYQLNVIDASKKGQANLSIGVKDLTPKNGVYVLEKGNEYVVTETITDLSGQNKTYTAKAKVSDTGVVALGKATTVDATPVQGIIAKSAGISTLTVTLNDATATAATIKIKVIDKSEASINSAINSVTINPALTTKQDTKFRIYDGFDGVVTAATLVPAEKNGFTGVTASCVGTDNFVTVSATTTTGTEVKAGSGILKVTVKAPDASTVDKEIKFSVKIKKSAPTVKCKQTKKMNTFYKNMPAVYSITPTLDAAISSVEVYDETEKKALLADTDYTFAKNASDGIYYLTVKTATKSTKITVKEHFATYNNVTEQKKMSVQIESEKLGISTNNGTMLVNAANNGGFVELSTTLIDKANKNVPVDLTNIDVSLSGTGSENFLVTKGTQPGEILITGKTGSLPTKNTKMKINLTSSAWNAAKAFDYTAKVSKLGSAKLKVKSGTVTLYNYQGLGASVSTGISLNGYAGNASALLNAMVITSGDTKPASKEAFGNKFTAYYDPETSEIVVKKLSDDIANGNYKVAISVGGAEFKNPLKTTITVKVSKVEVNTKNIISRLGVRNNIDILNRGNTRAILTPGFKNVNKTARITNVKLVGDDAELFDVEGFDAIKGTVDISLKSDAKVLVGYNYLVGVKYTVVDGASTIVADSPSVKVKFSQRNPRMKLYGILSDSGQFTSKQSGKDKLELTMTSSSKPIININATDIKLVKAPEDFSIDVVGNSVDLSYSPKGGTVGGRNVSLTFEVLPEGSALNAKPLTVKYNVKVVK